MRKGFFERFEPQEKAVHKSVSLTESEWRLIEAYKLYGSSRAGHEIPVQRILREIIVAHLQGDRDFVKDQSTWLTKLAALEGAASGEIAQ